MMNLPLLDCNIIFDLAPIFTGILGWLLLKEDYGIRQFLLGILGLFGGFLVTQPAWFF